MNRFNGSAAAAVAPCLALALLLAGCGGEAGSATSDGTSASTSSEGSDARDATTQSAATDADETDRLFIPDVAHSGIATLATGEPDAGEVLPASTLKTSAALGSNVQVDPARDELYAIAGRMVVVYAGASTLKAGATPTRSFPLPSTLAAPHALYLDADRDELYVGGDTPHGNGQIVSYPYAHTIRGTPATPSRAMFVDHGVAFFTIDSTRQRLFVVNADAGVHVFADAGSATGALVAATTIPVLGTGLAIDAAHDRLYVADIFAGLILVDQASAATPTVSATISIDDARFVAFDPVGDRAYVSALGSLYTFDNASAMTSATMAGLPATAAVPGTSFGAVAVR